MPNQTDVAKLASVSTATVSRVINGRGVVTEDVRIRVEQAIEALQYVPNAGARALASQRSRILGAIIPTLKNAIFADGINAFERAAQSRGYAFILAVAHEDSTHHFDHVVRMIERGVDGLLLVGNEHDPAIFSRLEKASVRHVCTWAFDKHSRAPNIGFDNAQAMHSVVDHLVELEHTKIGMLCGRTDKNDRASKRLQGVVTRLNHHGLALPPRCIVETDYSIRNSRKAFWKLIENDVSAIICGNDVIAQGALLEALKMGLVVPEDLSITGFDDLEISAELQPALTSVNVAAQAMGDNAAHALIDAVENKSPVAGMELGTQLVIRQTTGRSTPLLLTESSIGLGDNRTNSMVSSRYLNPLAVKPCSSGSSR